MQLEIRNRIIDLEMKHTNYIHIILSLIFTLMVNTQLQGQTKNNIMSIDDRIYAVYQRGWSHLNDSLVFSYVDSMSILAEKYNDPKAEALAYTLPLRYYFRKNDEEGMEQAVAKCKHIARKNGYLQYFYYAYNEQCTMLINMKEYNKVKHVLKEAQEWVQKDNLDYGWAICYSQLGHLARHTYNYELAIDYYKKARDFYEKANQPLSTTYINIASCYSSMHDHDLAKYYYEQAYQASVSDQERMSALVQMANFANQHMLFDDLDDLYERIQQLSKTCGEPTDAYYVYVKLKHYLNNKQYDLYQKELENIKNPLDKLCYQQYYAEQTGDYKEAYLLGTKILAMVKESTSHQTQVVLSDLSNRMETALLETENAELELEQKELEAKHNRMIAFFLFFLMCLVVVIFIFYMRVRNKTISRLKIAWTHARKEEQKAIEANKIKDEFVQNMSHEIRTPLNAICGLSQMLSDPQMDGMITVTEKEEYNGLIKANTNMLTSLVEDILYISDIENGRYKVDKNEYSLNTICHFSVETAMVRCPENVRLYYTSEVNNDYMIMTDKNRVQQVLMNMLTNSCKHTQEGEIHLHCAVNETNKKVIFTVTDTGKGVPPEMAEEIFNRFKKLDAFVQGTGLGLSISREIAELLEGRIYLDTSYTQGGARFIFEIKLYQPTMCSNNTSKLN